MIGLTTFQLAETKVDFPLSTQTIFYEEEDLDFSEESIWLEAEVKLDDDSDFNCISESDSDNSQYEFISTFLHAISERPIPVNTAASISGLQKWMEDILEVVSRPSSPAAKRLFKTSPSMVLFANQLHLVHRCGPEIEIVAQKASSRDYYYDFLTRNFGHERAQDWLTGRGELDGNKRKAALPCSGLLKRVLVNQALKAFNALDSSDDCSDY